jgi:CDP-paratose 2-epimerase
MHQKSDNAELIPSAAAAAHATPHGERRPTLRPRRPLRDTFGACQWFHFQEYENVEKSVSAMKDLGVRHLRTGISWADYCRPGGKEFYDWQFARLADFEILLSIWHTPPSISEGNACNAPPRRLRDYADFIDRVISEFGSRFHHLELWNEPNNRLKWDFPNHDPQWRKFGQMIGDAAYWAKQRGVHTVLGGMIPVDHHWLELMTSYGVMKYIDVVGIHAFPGMWWPDHPNWDWHEKWEGWNAKVDYIRKYTDGKPVWVTETGLATYDLALKRVAKYEVQVRQLEDAAACTSADRLYWYSLIDLDPQREAIEGFHVDENEYHMGLVNHWDERKPAFHTLQRLMAKGTPEPHAPSPAVDVAPRSLAAGSRP